MIPVIATSAVAFSIWLAYRLHKNTKLEDKQKESFWERENRANATITGTAAPVSVFGRAASTHARGELSLTTSSFMA